MISDLTTIPIEGTGMDDDDVLPGIIDLALSLVKKDTGILVRKKVVSKMPIQKLVVCEE